jgi:hypothetical protein
MALARKKVVLRPKYPEAAVFRTLDFSFEIRLTTGAGFTIVGLSEHLVLQGIT